ncbi:type VI secretion system protein ImpG [Luteibacter rhizovicinus]|uniref:Type VI secretion system protein ImpG n=1 Tax=Luteibacter rhizovicinus TaxID=242606 RepID=A0A4V2W4V0_9GAMM|nr:type VI secretion system baseplate subunit TssF [Luteibacter rhizovicinus]TCV97299.1 type VI secretion system protein ImpG [Luteibacter rhizovicinus]
MDDGLLRHYEEELRFLRDSGVEFARAYPAVASRLGLDDERTADPGVERLLEGLAFLTARIQRQMDAGFPQFTENLLSLIDPSALAMVPSMAVLRFEPDIAERSLAAGYRVPMGTPVRATAEAMRDCEFRTSRDVTLWPLAIDGIDLLHGSVLRLRLRCAAGCRFSDLSLDELPLFIPGNGAVANFLYEALICPAGVFYAMAADEPMSGENRHAAIHTFSISPPADEDDIYPDRGNTALRTLRHFLAFPQGGRFVRLAGLAPAVRSCHGDRLDLHIPVGSRASTLLKTLDDQCLALFCTPVLNLFRKRTERILVDGKTDDIRVVVDRSRPRDYDVYGIESVHMRHNGRSGAHPLHPAYSATDTHNDAGYYRIRRSPRMAAGGDMDQAGYRHSDTFISIVESGVQAEPAGMGELSIVAWCTNGALPYAMAHRGGATFVLDAGGPVRGVRCMAGPSRAMGPPPPDRQLWHALAYVSRSYLQLACDDAEAGAAALRDLLRSQVDGANAPAGRLIDGIRGLRSEPAFRRAPGPGPVSFARGLRLLLTLDDDACESVGACLAAAALEVFFARYAALNTFTETVLETTRRGRVAEWPARAGRCVLL